MATSNLLFEDVNEKILKEDLFSVIAESLVQRFKRNDRYRDRSSGKERQIKNAVSMTQLRKFYNDFLVLKHKLDVLEGKDKQENFKKILPYIKMAKAKVAYAKQRKNVNSAFKEFIDEYVDSINDIDDFEAFCDFFEAIVAFGTFYLDKK